MKQKPANRQEVDATEAASRRAFLRNCATYAAAMPPAISLLLSARAANADHSTLHACLTDPPSDAPDQNPHCENVGGSTLNLNTTEGEPDPELLAQ